MSAVSPDFVDAVAAALEDLPAGGDFYAPSFLTLDPDGTVSADFEGHLHAAGLDLDTGTSYPPEDDNKVRWLDPADGTTVDGEVFTTESATGSGQTDLHIVSHLRPGSTEAQAFLTATEEAIAEYASLVAYVEPAPDPLHQVYAIAAGASQFASARLIDQLGRSDYVQLADGPARWRLREVSGSANPPPLTGNNSTSFVVPLPAGSAAVGDLVIFLGDDFTGLWPIWRPHRPTITTADQVTMRFTNAHTTSGDPPVTEFTFLIVNRS